jgi:DNA recombination protein RmuC
MSLGLMIKFTRHKYPLNNGYIADAMLYAPEPLGTIAIDSKFPLEHYQIMTDTKS